MLPCRCRSVSPASMTVHASSLGPALPFIEDCLGLSQALLLRSPPLRGGSRVVVTPLATICGCPLVVRAWP